MNSYVYMKPNTYRSYGPSMDFVTRGQAGTDAEAIALARDGEIVARIVDGQPASREDGRTRANEFQPPEAIPAPTPVHITDDIPL